MVMTISRGPLLRLWLPLKLGYLRLNPHEMTMLTRMHRDQWVTVPIFNLRLSLKWRLYTPPAKPPMTYSLSLGPTRWLATTLITGGPLYHDSLLYLSSKITLGLIVPLNSNPIPLNNECCLNYISKLLQSMNIYHSSNTGTLFVLKHHS